MTGKGENGEKGVGGISSPSNPFVFRIMKSWFPGTQLLGLAKGGRHGQRHHCSSAKRVMDSKSAYHQRVAGICKKLSDFGSLSLSWELRILNQFYWYRVVWICEREWMWAFSPTLLRSEPQILNQFLTRELPGFVKGASTILSASFLEITTLNRFTATELMGLAKGGGYTHSRVLCCFGRGGYLIQSTGMQSGSGTLGDESASLLYPHRITVIPFPPPSEVRFLAPSAWPGSLSPPHPQPFCFLTEPLSIIC